MTIPNTPEMNYALPQEQTPPPKKNTGAIIAIISVLTILAVVAVTVFFALGYADNNSGKPTPSNTSTALTTDEDPGISLGKDLVAGTKNEGATQVDIYFDYACSHCNHLGNDYGAELGEAAKAGDITLVYHPVSIMSTLFSYTGAAAEFFVAENEPDKYFVFHELLHEKIMTPYMNGDLNDPRAQNIVDIAKEAGVSEENCEALSKELTEMEDILLKNDHSRSTSLLDHVITVSDTFVNNSMKATGSAGTPTVYIDGKKSESWSTDIPSLLSK